MRRLVYIITLLFLTSFFSVASAAEFNFERNSSKTNSCVVKVDRVYYVANNTFPKTLYDEFLSTAGDKYISGGRTTISMWESDSNLVSNCDNANAWKRKSDVAPNNTRVVATAANCVFNKPTNKNKRDVQVVYNIWYSKITTWWSSSVRKEFITTSNFLSNPNNFSEKTYPNYKSVAEWIHGNECFNVELRYCGDGILETNNWEVCDPEDALKRGFGNGGCNTNTCQPINNPVCKQLTVNKTTGTAPTDVVATCTGFKVNNWEIDCGNGQVFTGKGNNSGNQTFTKTCNYKTGGKYTPICTINNSITSNSCQKTVNISNPVPSILVDKTDANIFDFDWNIGWNDSQSVQKGDEAVFKIRVTNNGKESLKDIELIDTVEQSCATRKSTFVDLKNARFINKDNNRINITFWGKWNFKNSTLEVWEWFEYTCEKSNTTSNYTNTAQVYWVWVTSWTKVNDSDPTKVVVVWTPKINVDKRDANDADLDGNVGWNDSQTVTFWDKAVFRITVTNNGTENLKNIKLIDTVEQSCATRKGTFVDLKNSRFTNKDNVIVNISVSGLWNHSDNILQVWEKLTYVCEKSNTQDSYTNTVNVEGTWVTTWDKVTDSDPTEVITDSTPAIEVVKEDANSNDLDGEQYNDSQTVLRGEEAVFNITVKNTWNEDLKDIILTDAQALACGTKPWTVVNLSNATFKNNSDVSVVINYLTSSPGSHTDNILQVGEEFSYTCAAPNTQSNYTNIVVVEGTGINSWDMVDDDDPSVVILTEPTPSIYLIKSLAPGQSETVKVWDTVHYIITVFNTGSLIGENYRVEDQFQEASGGWLALAPQSSDLWSLSDGIAEYKELIDIPVNDSVALDIYFTITDQATWKVRNLAIVCPEDEEDCTPVEPVCDPLTDDCCDDEDEVWNPEGCVVVEIEEYDLALRKVVKTTGLLNKWDSVTFTITVFNQGTIDSGIVEITDYIPNGLTLTGSTWTQSGSMAVRTIANIPAGENTPVDITFTIDNDAPKNINNFAEISDDTGDDCDSNPDSINGWDETGETTWLIDNEIGINCEEWGDEDDHDIAPIVIEDGEDVTPSCDLITASPNSNQGSSLTSTLTCTGTAVDTYRIEVRDEAGNLVNTINASTGEVTLDRGSASTANFTAKCFINNTVTSNSCEQSLQITNQTWGWNPAVCLDIIKTSTNTYQCVWNKNANSISMRCGTNADTGNTVYLPTQAWILGTDDRRTANFTCWDAVPKCIVRKLPWAATPINENNWVDSAACEYAPGFCGDGVVWFRADGTQEVCDAGTNNGKAWFTCTAQCTIPGGWSSSGGSSWSSSTSSSGGWEIICNPVTEVCSITTTPTWGEIVFGPFGGTVVGHAKNILENIPQFPFIQNTSEYDYSFEELCIKKTSGDPSVARAQDEICVNMRNKVLYGYETLFIAQHKDRSYYEAVGRGQIESGDFKYPDFMSNKDAIPSLADFGQAVLTTSIKHDIDDNGTIDILYDAYFAADLDVRVAKPSIATIGGWVSYVKNGSETTGDIKKVTDWITGFEDNTNFVWVSVSDNWVSSSVETNTDTVVITNTETDSNDYTEDVESVVTVTTSASDNVSGFDKFSNFNGLDNVYIITDKNITLAELPASVSVPTTYIVEWGNLTLTKDIITNENIAFVVKGWNINVKSEVEKLSGTYIAIPVNNVGGKIISESSNKQLVVYGSLLGNLDQLISNRYYIEKTGNQLSVGTIVSFGSRLLSKPAPLVAQFKSEYNASQKVAR